MPKPCYLSIKLSLPRYSKYNTAHSNREAIAHFANHSSLTEAERKEFLPNGKQASFDNRNKLKQLESNLGCGHYSAILLLLSTLC